VALGADVLFGLFGQMRPGLRHPEQEYPAVRINNLLGEFDAIGCVEPVTGYVFPTHEQSPYVLLHILQVAAVPFVPAPQQIGPRRHLAKAQRWRAGMGSKNFLF
jgi:hypothetical protein